ncbi:hypothetical protein ACFOJ6_19705 [Gordonia humi]|uniref:hypothetical protein n=1 Tax=Gordonia humi TaxID=686429 RepID=UPI0036102BC3
MPVKKAREASPRAPAPAKYSDLAKNDSLRRTASREHERVDLREMVRGDDDRAACGHVLCSDHVEIDTSSKGRTEQNVLAQRVQQSRGERHRSSDVE